jgi:hypothetical protein
MNRFISVFTPPLFALTCAASLGCMAGEEPTRDAPTKPSAEQPTPPAEEPDPEPQPEASHSGLVSIQDVRIANLPAAGHGLTVNILLTPAAAPDYEERPGELEGCRVWRYDLTQQPAPAEQDHGALDIDGLSNGPIRCSFAAQRGYVCPTAQGATEITTSAASAGQSRYVAAQGDFTASDVGRYLSVQGASNAANNGAFPIERARPRRSHGGQSTCTRRALRCQLHAAGRRRARSRRCLQPVCSAHTAHAQVQRAQRSGLRVDRGQPDARRSVRA